MVPALSAIIRACPSVDPRSREQRRPRAISEMNFTQDHSPRAGHGARDAVHEQIARPLLSLPFKFSFRVTLVLHETGQECRVRVAALRAMLAGYW